MFIEGLFAGMFFGGLLAALMFFLFIHNEGKFFIVGIICYVGGYAATVLSIHDGNQWLYSLFFFSAGVICFFIFKKAGLFKSKNNKTNNTYPKSSLYINHCWNCGHTIDSRVNELCPKCQKHYICPNCGKCWCDDPRNGSHNTSFTGNNYYHQTINTDIIEINRLIVSIKEIIDQNKRSNYLFTRETFSNIEDKCKVCIVLLKNNQGQLSNINDYLGFIDCIAAYLSYCDDVGLNIVKFNQLLAPKLESNLEGYYNKIISGNSGYRI